MTTLSDKAIEVLGDLPFYYQGDRNALAVVDAVSRELQRIEDWMEAFIQAYFPTNATDETGTLPLWEATLNLPVRPAGVSVEQRRNNVAAAYRKRSVGMATEWVANVTKAVSSAWSHEVNQPIDYSVRVSIPDTAGFTGGQLQVLLRQMTPAHLALTTTVGDGFKVDVGQVDIDTI